MIRDDEKNRRDFLKNLAVAGGLMAAAPAAAEAATAAPAPCAPHPTSAEVANAAYNASLTYQLVQNYRLTAMDVAGLIDRLPVKPVPW
jgi:hypothetical protein